MLLEDKVVATVFSEMLLKTLDMVFQGFYQIFI